MSLYALDDDNERWLDVDPHADDGEDDPQCGCGVPAVRWREQSLCYVCADCWTACEAVARGWEP